MLIEKNINHNLWSKFINTTYQNNIYTDHRNLEKLENNYENFVLNEKNLPVVGAIIFDENLENIPTFIIHYLFQVKLSLHTSSIKYVPNLLIKS